MIYCAATEDGYEKISGKSIGSFIPEFGKDDEGNTVVKKPADVTTGDFLILAYAGIAAAASRENKKTPIEGEYMFYDITPKERSEIVPAIIELRNKWYEVPEVIKPEIEEGKEETNPNDQPPTTSSKES